MEKKNDLSISMTEKARCVKRRSPQRRKIGREGKERGKNQVGLRLKGKNARIAGVSADRPKGESLVAPRWNEGKGLRKGIA